MVECQAAYDENRFMGIRVPTHIRVSAARGRVRGVYSYASAYCTYCAQTTRVDRFPAVTGVAQAMRSLVYPPGVGGPEDGQVLVARGAKVGVWHGSSR